VVLDDEGHVLTNHHVVAEAERVIVTLGDGQVLAGTVVGGDEESDIALLRVEGKGLKPAAFGDSEKLKVGQPVLAIGNPLGLAGGPTVTSGVVSSLRRNVQLRRENGIRVIQTDAAVNPGNSGGPLVDLEGKVVAINTVTIPYAEGIGFAIPINDALHVAREILEHGRVLRPWLGIVGYDVDRRVVHYYGLTATRGIFVVEVSSGSPAEAAGIRTGDVLVSLGERRLDALSDLVETLKERKIGETTEVEVERASQRIRIRVPLGQRPF
jgi:S1-C subfamily serine protease